MGDFDPDAYLSAKGSDVFDPDAYLGAKEVPKSAPTSSWSDAITDIPSEIKRTAGEHYDTIKHGLFPGGQGQQGQFERFLNTGKAVAAVPGLLASPLTGAARSLIGHPMAKVEHAIGTVINPEVAAKDDPAKMYDTARGDVDLAMSAMAPKGGLRGAPVAPPAPSVPPTNEIVAAANRVSQVVPEPINVPRAFASDNIAVQRAGQLARNVPFVGDRIPQATGEMAGQMGNAVKSIASHYGEGSGPNVANRIGRTIGEAGEAESQAANAAAASSDAAVLADWERAHNSVRSGIGGVEANAADAARQTVGDMSPQDMGATLIARLRQGEQEARATKERLYGIAGSSDGAIDANAVRGLKSDVMKSLDENGVVVDPVVNGHSLTPAAARMVSELENVPGIRLPARSAPPLFEKPAASGPTQSAPRPATPEAQSLTEFLAAKGGLGPDAELEAIGAHSHTVNVDGMGRRKLVRQGGWPLDYAREAAEEAGYLRGDHKGTSSVNDLLDAIDAEMRGQKLYPEGFDGYVGSRKRSAMSEREKADYDRHIQGFESDLADAGHGELGRDVKDRAVRLMESEGMDADTAVEHALSQLEQEDMAGASHPSGFPGDRAATNSRSVDMQTLEQTRKRLNSIKGAASNDADRRAARHVMNAFDDWIGNAFDKALFSGSDEALQSYRAARAANADWRTRFGFNERDDADRIVNRIVTGEVTPQEVSNYVVGASKVGAKGVSSRLLTRLAEATGDDPEALQAIRGGVWNRLSQTTEGTAAKPPAKVIGDIHEFLNGSGRDVANRLFTPEQQGVMRAYANMLRRGTEQRELLDEVAKNTKPTAMPVGSGPMRDLATAVLGKNGKTDEALFSAIDAYARSGGRADVQTLADIVRNIPEKDRGDLAGAIIRNLGHSDQANGFSPEKFATEWKKYTPQAKSVLFGNAGAHRQALDDIAAISQRYKEVGRRFGNPSGTAQNVAGMGVLASVVTHPYVAIPSLVGGAIFARLLSAPASAQKVAILGKAANALSRNSTPAKIAVVQSAAKGVAMAANRLGADIAASDIIRAMQGPVPAGADQEKPNPERKINGQPNRSEGERSHKAHGGPIRLATGGAANHNHTPTEAQQKAGNYAKTHKWFHGLDISIENLKGSKRSGVSKTGKAWSVKMPAHYGYIKGTVGADKDHVDCYLGPNEKSDQVFVVDQKDDKTGRFDEHKCLIGFNSEKEAKATYLAGFSDGKNRIKHMRRMTINEFKDWLKRGDTARPVKAQDVGLRVAYRVKAAR